MDKGQHVQKQNKDRGFLSDFIWAALIFGAIIGFKYGKSKLFPDKQALFFEELYQWELENKDKEIFSPLSEKPITKGEFKPYEIAIRKNRNLNVIFHNKILKSLNPCMVSLQTPRQGLKSKMKQCYRLAVKNQSKLLEYKQKNIALFESLEGGEFFLKQFNKNYNEDLKFFKQLASIFYILASSSYKISDNRVFFIDKDDKNNFEHQIRKILKTIEEDDKKSELRLAHLKENSKQVKVGAKDALATAIIFLGGRVRR